jgi:hypothetical protein
MSLVMIVPTKSRPENMGRLLHAVNATAGDELERLVFAVDADEPRLAEYQQEIPENTENSEWDWVDLVPVNVTPQRMGPVLNALAADRARWSGAEYIGFMGDDHLPRTQDWDLELITALGGRPGVAYGNDLAQGEKLPTAVVISSDIICALGFMCPPGQDHLYLDDFWKLLGETAGNLAYCPDTVIEHLHPHVGKARWDDSYAQNNSADQYKHDQDAYQRFLDEQWPGCVARLKAAGITD